MDRLTAMELFARIVEGGTFAGAARDLGIARSTATLAITELEADLGTRLLARTTRHVSPTPEGAAFYHRARALLADVEETWAGFDGTPRGHLRINAPGLLTRTFLVPALPGFLARYPDITVSFGQTERLVDLVREGVDCVLRAGTPEDSSLMMRRLGTMAEVTCASPAYLARHGTPRGTDDLDGHLCVGFVSSRTGEVMPLEFRDGDRLVTRQMPARVSTDNADTAADLALQGFGLIQAPRYRFASALASGALVEVLADTPPDPTPLNALYPGSRHLSRRLDVFLDWVGGIFDTGGPDRA
ncbi:LysR family transcriptional regulator [Pseudooceanicola sp. LIPI14-2-Ac024]|uniref:LysR family transcriptional regulator n=1 Tax=Pseudooceanicola sp. LIPI14-2-Ac024 TaxID=3344875 RepID=UPI0035D06F7C